MKIYLCGILAGVALFAMLGWGDGVIQPENGTGGSVSASVTNAVSTVSSNGVQVATGVTNLNFLTFGTISNVNGNVFINPAAASATGPYILFTNGHGTNTSFWDGLKVDADGMTNVGPYRGKYVLSESPGVTASSATNISAIGVWGETDEIFTAVEIKVTDTAESDDTSALLRLRFDPQGAAHNVDWINATNVLNGATFRVFTDGSSSQSGNATVHGTVSLTNLVVTNRVIHAVRALTYSGTNVTVDWSQGIHWYLLLTNNAKLWFTNAPGLNFGETGLIDFEQDGTGSRLLYWDNTNIRTNPANAVVLTTTAGGIDDMHVKTYGLTGTNFHILLNTGWAK